MKRKAGHLLACLGVWAAPAFAAEPAPAPAAWVTAKQAVERPAEPEKSATGAAEPAAALKAGAEASGEQPAAAGPCEPFEQRLARRVEWLRARRQEQFERGGPPDPAKGIPSAIALWCQEHPGDEDCKRGGVTIELRPEELAWNPEKTPEDYDAHVLLMKRELNQCRRKQARGR